MSERAVAEFDGSGDCATYEPTGDAKPDALVATCTEAAVGSTCVVKIEGGGAFNVKTKTAPNDCTIPTEMTLKNSPPQGSALDDAFGDMSVGVGTNFPSHIAPDDARCG